MKDVFYFSHDYNARNDEKIIKLLNKMGWEGYGLYWGIIEKLYEAGGFLEKDYENIAFDMRTQSERIREVIESGLFLFSNEKFYSKSCNARLIARKGKSEAARQSAFFRWHKQKKEDANAKRTLSGRYARKERKGKEKKGNNIAEQALLKITPIEENKSIEEIFKTFYESGNKGINFGNKTERSAAEWLIKEYGLEKSINTIKYAMSLQDKQYAPIITTPFQLKNNLSKLIAYYKREQTPKKGIVPEFKL